MNENRRLAALVAVTPLLLVACNPSGAEATTTAPSPTVTSSANPSATRSPSAAIVAEVRRTTDRSGYLVETVTLPTGERMKRASLGSGFQHVLLGRRDADGNTSTACVDNAPAAESFLAGTAASGAHQ